MTCHALLSSRLGQFLCLSATMLVAGGRVTGQCQTNWSVRDGFPAAAGITGLWDPDGAGPAQPRLVMASSEMIAAGQTYPGGTVVVVDPVTGDWSALGGAPAGRILGLGTGPNGELLLGYESVPVQSWNGTAWVPLGTGPTFGSAPYGNVTTFAVMPNGDLIAAGQFTGIGGVSASNIARWNGTAWSPLGLGLGAGSSSSRVNALLVLPNGDLVAGGSFTNPGNNIARWDGTSWHLLHHGLLLGNGGTGVGALATMPNGDVIAAGNFTLAGTSNVDCVARWDGTAWSPVGSPTVWNGAVHALVADASGSLFAGGYFQDATVKQWNGSTWTILPGLAFPGSTGSMTLLPSGDLVATGVRSTGCAFFTGIARWDGAAWSGVGQGAIPGPGSSGGSIESLAALPGGDLVIGGYFSGVGSACVNNIARRTGTTWSALGTGTDGPVRAMTILANGDLVAAGGFRTAGAVSASGVARWDGSAWSSLGTGLIGGGTCLARSPNGDILVGEVVASTTSRIHRWSGSAWSQVGADLSGTVSAIAVLPNGDVVAGGWFSTPSTSANCIARWDGSSWNSMQAGLGSTTAATVQSLLVLRNGDLIAGGTFTSSGATLVQSVARWNGSMWSPLGSGLPSGVSALLELPDGDLLAGRAGTPGVSGTGGTYRWNGTTWTALPLQNRPRALLALPDGSVVAGGTVFNFPGFPALSTLTSTCPATAVAAGAGCMGSGGPLTLAATALPWIGSTFRARCQNVAPLALAGVVTGFAATSIPIATLVPQGGPGCDLLVSLDAVTFAVPVAGTVDTQIAIPSSPSLVGMTVRHQVVPIELDPVGSLLAVTSSNALAITVGAF